MKIPSKNSLLQSVLFGILLLLLMNGCQSNLSQNIPLVDYFYDDPKNWAVLDSSIPIFASDYDVFFVYPTQIAKLPGYYFNWLSGSVGHDVHNYVALQNQRQFGKRVRIFAPFVPELDYEQYTQLLNANKEILKDFYFTNTPLNVAIRFTVQALQNYMANYHKAKRPFFLVGCEQGAVILYEALRQCPKINAEQGLLAVYLFGIPGLTADRIKKDFKKNHLVPAMGRLDLGVVAVINTRMPDIPLEETYYTPGGYVINPLNWSTENHTDNETDNKTDNITGNETDNETDNITCNDTDIITGNETDNKTDNISGNETDKITGNETDNKTDNITDNETKKKTEKITKVSRDHHLGAVFYKRQEKFLRNRVVETPHFCSAGIDTENALINIYDLPEGETEKRQKELENEFRELILHEQALFSNAWGIFAKNISANAIERTQKYLFIKRVLKPSDLQED